MKQENILFKIKSEFFIKNLINDLDKKKQLQFIKGNKELLRLMKKNINDYKEYHYIFSTIEIEIKPSETYGKFINLDNKDEGEEERKKNYHIYFNDSKVEKKINII